jgi:alcohol dehydrogenase
MAEHATVAVLAEPRRLEVRHIPLPELADDDGLLRIEACGLCGTDHEEYTGHLRAPFEFVPGHEVVGIVEQAGPTALARWGVRVGDRVAVEVFLSCRTCNACRSGAYRLCEQHGVAHTVGFMDVAVPPGLWGGYATHLYLSPDSLLVPVPEGLDPVLATAFNPLGAGLRWAGELARTQPGDVVAVLGPGIRGLSCCAAAKSAGAAFLMVTGFGPRDAGRLALAGEFGADLAVDVSTDDPVRSLRKATGRLADVVVDVTAKAETAPGQALQIVRSGGTVILAGTRGGNAPTPGFDPDLVVYKELRVLGALGVDTASYRAALDLLASGVYPFAALPRRVAGFDSLGSLLATLAGELDGELPVHAVFVPGAGTSP